MLTGSHTLPVKCNHQRSDPMTGSAQNHPWCLLTSTVNTWYNAQTHTCLMALSSGIPGWAGTRKVNQSGSYWSKRQWVAVVSAGRMQVCTSLHTDNHASTPTLSFLQAGCPSCRPNNSVKALKAINTWYKDAVIAQLQVDFTINTA